MKQKLVLSVIALTAVVAFSTSASAVGGIAARVTPILCAFVGIFRSVATGVAAVVMVIAGIKWIGSENDPGARKAAKDTMVHAIVGLIIVMIIGSIIDLFTGIRVFGQTLGNPCL